MKKLIILVTLLLFLSGCEIKYNLLITDEEKIKETISVNIPNETIANYNMSIPEFLDYYSNIYQQNEGYENFNITSKEGKSISSITATREYGSLDEYKNSYSFKSLFNTATIERIGKYVSFTTSENMFLQSIKNDELVESSEANKTYEISIKFYNEVANHNADKVDEKNNIYTWNINKNTTKDKIYFKIGPKVRYDVKIKDYITNHLFTIIFFGVLFISIIIVSLYFYIKIKKSDEID